MRCHYALICWERTSCALGHGNLAFAHSRRDSSLRQLILDKQIDVLGELGLQYRGISIGDPSMAPYLDLAEELAPCIPAWETQALPTAAVPNSG